MSLRRTRSLCTALVAPLASCGPGADLSTMRVEQVERAVLAEDGAWTALAEDADDPVRVDVITPWSATRGAKVAAPSLVLVPPSTVRVTLGEMPPGARLRLRAGFDGAEFRQEGEGVVSCRVSLGDREATDWRVSFGSDVAEEQRAWSQRDFELDGAVELTITTELVTPLAEPPRFGVGGFEIVTRTDVARGAASEATPNVVLVVMDTLRADRLGCYGYERPLSPNLDALAERGTLFESSYSAAPSTWPSTASSTRRRASSRTSSRPSPRRSSARGGPPARFRRTR